ncbi:MAG: trypsin-like peptidase domain-containing protein [Chloroflexi bacterium]|nr:trypsin-like peptidase domain-containing protein [Chloroflexota bacterium]
MNRLFPVGAGIAALTLFVGAACSSTGGGTATATKAATTTAGTLTTSQQTVAVSASQASLASLVQKTQPAVVRIETSSGVGSGFFVTSDGYIMTNNHVIVTTTGRSTTVASKISVGLDDGTTKTASVVGTDAKSDLALLKVDGSGFPYLKLASLENTNVGDQVIAIGYALDLTSSAGSPTVTQGIISAKNRSIDESSTGILGAVQTDAAITHGNSGGPLINYNGEVVGINTSLVPDQETGQAAVGIGLAVGSDTVNAVFKQLRDNGKVNRGLLGVRYFQPLLPGKAKELGIPTDIGGVYLPTQGELAQLAGSAQVGSSVQPGGPAAQAGIQPGDVIVSIAGSPVKDESQLAVALIENGAGKKVSVEVYRGGKKITIDVTLGTATSA